MTTQPPMSAVEFSRHIWTTCMNHEDNIWHDSSFIPLLQQRDEALKAQWAAEILSEEATEEGAKEIYKNKPMLSKLGNKQAVSEIIPWKYIPPHSQNKYKIYSKACITAALSGREV